jgi:hypothetical protein
MWILTFTLDRWEELRMVKDHSLETNLQYAYPQ